MNENAAERAYAKLTAFSEEVGRGESPPVSRALSALGDLYRETNLSTLLPMLPLFLRLKGKPMSLAGHFPMEPLYARTNIPRSTVLMCGRQVSKCAAAGSLVTLAGGERKAIQQIVPGDTVLAPDAGGFLAPSQVVHTFANGVKPLLRVTTAGGAAVTITPEHRLFRYGGGLVQAREIKRDTILISHGDRSASPDPVVCVQEVPPAEVFDIEVAGRHSYLLDGVASHNSTTLAALGVIRAAAFPHRTQLFVTPLQTQVQRFSNNFVRPFITHSLFRSFLLTEGLASVGGAQTKQNVFQRSFANESHMQFSYCWLDCERVRGIPADMLYIDEFQDIEYEFLPVLNEVLSASDLRICSKSGSAKTSENGLSVEFNAGSQGHWMTKCEAGHHNLFAPGAELESTITEEGLRCVRCKGLLDPSTGHWHHLHPERRRTDVSYHVPQIILPMHYAEPDAWNDILKKRKTYLRYRFLNECLGVPCDAGSRLITMDKLREMCRLPWPLSTEASVVERMLANGYERIVMGLDWGGGSGGELQRRRGGLTVVGGTESFTVPVIVGFRPGDPRPDVLYAEMLQAGMSPHEEAGRLVDLYRMFHCTVLAHDFTGAGFLREAMILQAGLPVEHLFPVTYTHMPTRPHIRYNPPPAEGGRRYYSLDKTRSLVLLMAAMNKDMVSFPGSWEEGRDLYEQFLALVEDKVSRDTGSDVYLIRKHPGKPDDFCHALNLAVSACWYITQSFSQLSSELGVELQGRDGDFADTGELDSAGW